tara:strand:+ start:217 stop:2091 length:1875 start_codon:yes stop_codon:yes gene_type:complete
MIKSLKKICLTIIIYLVSFNSFSQEGPKILTEIEQTDNKNKNSKKDFVNEVDNLSSDDNMENFIEINKKNEKNLEQKLVVDDIPRQFNNWYGVLSSRDGGLGWLMWRNTDYKLSMKFLKELPTNIYYSSLLKLYSNLLLSRAQSPKILYQSNIDKEFNMPKQDEKKYEYFDEKVRLLVELGLTKKIKLLEESIPLEVRDFLFSERLRDLRFISLDIKYICENIQNKLKDTTKKTLNRKILIACNIANNKEEQALLALDLLENDISEKDKFIKTARELIEGNEYINISFENIPKELTLILSLGNQATAKRVFKDKSLILDKLTYEMRLYTPETQIEALERLVNAGIYDSKYLKSEYIEYSKNEKEEFTQKSNDLSKNSLKIRSYYFKQAAQSEDEVDRAKNLNILWRKANEAGIENAISLITSDLISTISPENKLSWFVLPASKNLLIANEIEEAKKWLFFGNVDPKERASLDANFCKVLLLLYLKDKDINMNLNDIPDINFLLEILFNDINTDKILLERLMVTLKALNFEVDKSLWRSFLFKEKNKQDINSLSPSYQSLYFHLDYSVRKKNKAEVAIISIFLLSNYYKNNTDTDLYNALNALMNSDLDNYARDIAFEINSNLLR